MQPRAVQTYELALPLRPCVGAVVTAPISLLGGMVQGIDHVAASMATGKDYAHEISNACEDVEAWSSTLASPAVWASTAAPIVSAARWNTTPTPSPPRENTNPP